MKCFECGATCITVYHYGPSHGEPNPKVSAVSKACPIDGCGWESYPIKIPVKLE